MTTEPSVTAGASRPVELRRVPYDSADVSQLLESLQAVYVARYGDRDGTPVDPAEFAPPDGAFVVAYDDGEPVAMGGWRRLDPVADGVPGQRPVEIKRMYVDEAARGRGIARSVLAHLETDAAAAGADWAVLMSGQAQPEAVALYRSAGYRDIAPFGFYAREPDAVHLGKPLTSPDDPSLVAAR